MSYNFSLGFFGGCMPFNFVSNEMPGWWQIPNAGFCSTMPITASCGVFDMYNTMMYNQRLNSIYTSDLSFAAGWSDCLSGIFGAGASYGGYTSALIADNSLFGSGTGAGYNPFGYGAIADYQASVPYNGGSVDAGVGTRDDDNNRNKSKIDQNKVKNTDKSKVSSSGSGG